MILVSMPLKKYNELFGNIFGTLNDRLFLTYKCRYHSLTFATVNPFQSDYDHVEPIVKLSFDNEEDAVWFTLKYL